ncbi:hypothetical protein KFL_003170130 [Klebsormidium nitens]|uniref:Uncharacterized protein n=1 Tax=Klebsormidium nitens TaxID=105231 RepID=A0A1Y1I7D7_KLENI|nr:hypothetical protein KFL_003170130 [Klebsormidium nitens]|eukprot:GAQ86874.1 hypothetical protein KFL_003170130 [Klebsormidium nitens]
MIARLLMACTQRTCVKLQSCWQLRTSFSTRSHLPVLSTHFKFFSCCLHEWPSSVFPQGCATPVGKVDALPAGTWCAQHFGQSWEDGRLNGRRGVAAAAGTRVGLRKLKNGLGQLGTLKEPGWVGEEQEEEVTGKSKNQRKREASTALELAYDLADLSPKNLKQVVSVSGMPAEMLEAVTLAKGLGIDAKNGRKRQYAFVAKLFREHDMDVEEVYEIIRAAKDGTIQAGPPSSSSSALSSPEDDLTDGSSECGSRAAVWASGLLRNDPDTADEVYSLSDVIDGQHLRQLVRNAQKELAANESQQAEEPSSDAKEGLPTKPVQPKPQTKAQSALRRYLQDVAVRIEEME